MPVTDTITSFYSFTPLTIAKSSEVNTNFALMRGHWTSIDGSTTALAHQSYDLGSSIHNWRHYYVVGGVYYQSDTFTGTVLTGTSALFFKTDGVLYRRDVTGVDTEVGSGGGASAGIFWNDNGPNAPTKTVENNQIVYQFEAALAQTLYWQFKVPSTYVTGRQISLSIAWYSPSTSNAVQFRTVTTLIRNDTDAVSSVGNLYTSTAAAVTNNGSTNVLNGVTLDLTDANGLVGATVTAGDVLFVALYRDAADTDTGIVRLLPYAGEPIIS